MHSEKLVSWLCLDLFTDRELRKCKSSLDRKARFYSNNIDDYYNCTTDNIFIFNAILLVFLNTEMTHLINVIGSI